MTKEERRQRAERARLEREREAQIEAPPARSGTTHRPRRGSDWRR